MGVGSTSSPPPLAHQAQAAPDGCEQASQPANEQPLELCELDAEDEAGGPGGGEAWLPWAAQAGGGGGEAPPPQENEELVLVVLDMDDDAYI